MKIYTLYIAPYCGSNDGGGFPARVYSFLDIQKAGKRLFREMKEWMSEEQHGRATQLLKEKKVHELVAMNKASFPYDDLYEFEVILPTE